MTGHAYGKRAASIASPVRTMSGNATLGADMAKRTTRVIKGWHFEEGDFHYYVGANTAEEARTFLARQAASAAQTAPKSLPISVVRFFGLKEGTIVVGRVLERGKSEVDSGGSAIGGESSHRRKSEKKERNN